MKRFIFVISALFCTGFAHASDSVSEGVIEKAEAITTEVGKDGKPVLGAVAGAGIGSMFGSGSGNTAAKIFGGILGAKSQKSTKKTAYGWRYIVKVDEDLHVVDVWCEKAEEKCPGLAKGKEVYLLNEKEISVK
ncbi:hypothetical protein [Thalassomonas sp. M1454]|uniref:hypothetical protein n=1 Tax=Thalassomonas sp. M1454 TaxID=2594477 RepID=UPI00117E5364|nr:hypothetical protein [Thalassomonas sp. M1454]TRX53926.1 hypothetical protein FNN08_13300 [Thalassomonas sp. M1454]